jgi:hypothetical protein
MENNSDFTLLEILKMAKEIVINEHVDQRAEVHNQWLLDSDLLWKSRKLRLAYPTIPPYPTEIDIVVRAKVLMDFLNSGTHTQQTIHNVDQKEIKEIPITKTNLSPQFPENQYMTVIFSSHFFDN